MSEPVANVPERYVGLWRRRVLRDARGSDTTTQTYWLQTGSLYADIRVPAGAEPAPASVQGFAGRLEVEGAHLTWHRWLDCRPPTGIPDVGRMRFVNEDLLVEEGVLAPYWEVWERIAPASADRAAFVLGDDADVRGVFVVLGDWFMYALGEPGTGGAREIGLGRRDGDAGTRTIRLATLPGRVGRDPFALHPALDALRRRERGALDWRPVEQGAAFRGLA